MKSTLNLFDFDQAKLTEVLEELGEPGYRAQQILKWVHHRGVIDFDGMTNLSKSLRTKLPEVFHISPPAVAYEKPSEDGTYKWVLSMSDGNCIETIFIPEKTRGTLCVSSQVGCGLNCSFCSTARQGFNRNLTLGEIIGQVWVARQTMGAKLTNVVMMGMGEPLLNFDAVVSAMDLMLDDNCYGLAKRRVTLSTSGLVPQMRALAKQSACALAVSLHAPNDELRNTLVPLNKKYPIKQLLQACKDHFKNEPRRNVMFEYVMLEGINDQPEQAKQLAKILSNIPCKVNLIPFNPFPNTQYTCSPMSVIEEFKNHLTQRGIMTTIRKTRGGDIDAACGQLVGKVKDRTGRSRRLREQLA